VFWSAEDLPLFDVWRSERFSIGGREISVRVFPALRADQQFLDDWSALEKRSVEGNAFLSPHFILPSIKFLDSRKRVLLLAIFRADSGHDELIGIGAFLARPPTPRFPLPHLDAYRSPHTYLTGMLLDRDCQWLALEGLGAYLSFSRVRWCGIEFEDRLADSALDQIHQDGTITSVVRWSEYYRHRRAILVPAKAAALVDELMTDGNFGKELRRKRRRLEEKGRVGWRFRAGNDVTDESIDTFLRLEDQGWKQEEHKSMRARPGHESFFREMSRRFADDGRAFFTELTLDERVIASTCNFISGNVGFAFKIGWDQEFAAVSPGLLNELELMRCADRCLVGIDYVDSGASEGSFIDRLWRDFRYMTTGVVAGGHAGAALVPAVEFARRLKRRWHGD
jgi:hypothetical protein